MEQICFVENEKIQKWVSVKRTLFVEESKTKKCTGVMFVFTQNIDRRCKPAFIVNQLKSAGLSDTQLVLLVVPASRKSDFRSRSLVGANNNLLLILNEYRSKTPTNVASLCVLCVPGLKANNLVNTCVPLFSLLYSCNTQSYSIFLQDWRLIDMKTELWNCFNVGSIF